MHIEPRSYRLFAEGLEIVLERSGEGASELHLDVIPTHRNGLGILHGGAVFSLVDTGMALALMSLFEPGESCVTVEVKVNNIAPVREGRIVARSVVAHRGRTLAHVESTVTHGEGKLVAKALGTFFVRGERSELGRPRGELGGPRAEQGRSGPAPAS